MLDAKNTARITSVQTVYHQRMGSEPISIDGRFGRLVAAADPIKLDLEVGDGWTWLGGTLQGPVMLVLKNLEVKRNTYPTPEESADDAAKVVDICLRRGYPESDLYIPPGEMQVLSIENPQFVRLICRNGLTKVQGYLLPSGGPQ